MAREHVITIKLSNEERKRFQNVAEDMGLDVSAMIRALVRERERSMEEEPRALRQNRGARKAARR